MTVAEATQPAWSPPAAEIGLDDLRDLMEHVTQTTLSLQQTHEALQNQVARLQGELAEARGQLSRSRQLAALGEMAAGIAHEIRNPLGSIQLYVQVLADDLEKHAEQRELCRKISAAVAGVDRIIHDVLAFSRDTRVQPQPTTIDAIVRRTLEACDALTAHAGMSVQTRVAANIPITADSVLLVQALGNVVRNAVEAMSEQPQGESRLEIAGEVRTVRCPDGQRRRRAVFTVRDTGPGIAPEVVQRMFNPFFTTRATGTGLGLAIVHRIVDAHGGHINVRNARELNLGSGAIIELCLPCRASDARHAAAGAMPPPVAISIDCHDDCRTLLPQDAAKQRKDS
jgi:two-component system sensor histidine kinase HydH